MDSSRAAHGRPARQAYQRTRRHSPYNRPCMKVFGARNDVLSALAVTELMIASELLMLNTSNVGMMLKRCSRKFRLTLKSSCVIRSLSAALSATRLNVMLGWAKTLVGRITWPAGQGDGQSAG